MFVTKMRMGGMGVAMAASLWFMPSGAQAADVNVVRDLRCMIIMLPSAESPDKEVAEQAKLASFYFVGRIESKVPLKTLKSLMAAEVDKMENTNVSEEREKCFAFLSASSKAVMDITKQFETAPPPPAAKP